jgi:hypothetical protein
MSGTTKVLFAGVVGHLTQLANTQK